MRNNPSALIIGICVFLCTTILLTGCGNLKGEEGDQGKQGEQGPGFEYFVNNVEELNAALVEIEYTGGTIYVNSGEYLLNNHINITASNINIIGHGTSTVFKVNDMTHITAIIIGSIEENPTGEKVSNVSIRNILIDGNRDNQIQGDGGEYYQDENLEHLRVNGITIRYAKNITIEDVSIQNARSGGLVTEKGVDKIFINNLNVTNSYFDATAFYNTEYSIIKNCFFYNNKSAGISIDWECRYNQFSNNEIFENGTGIDGISKNPGIYLAYSNFNLFDNNIIEGNAGHGIIVTTQHIVETSGAKYNMFTDNMILNNGEYAMWITDVSCVGNSGRDNFYNGNSDDSIFDPNSVFNDDSISY